MGMIIRQVRVILARRRHVQGVLSRHPEGRGRHHATPAAPVSVPAAGGEGRDLLQRGLLKLEQREAVTRLEIVVITSDRGLAGAFNSSALKTAEAVIAREQQRGAGRPIVTEVERTAAYYPAEAYHQQYLEKGGRMGRGQSAEKGCTETIRCYG